MTKRQSNYQKNLQEQIKKLKNEIEELKTEREEAKKSMVYFMHEADVAQKELENIKKTTHTASVKTLKEDCELAQETIKNMSMSLNQACLATQQWQNKYNVLRNEIRRMTKIQKEALNIEYLRNVVINFLEKKAARSQLVPVLANLLQCTYEDQTKLHQIIQNNIAT